MHGSTETLYATLGLVIGWLAAWLLLRVRSRQALLQVKQTADELLAAGEQRLNELKGELKTVSAETDTLHERLRTETEKRAVAEEKNVRLADLEEVLQHKITALTTSAADNTVLKTRLAEIETRLEEERKNAAEKIGLLTEAREQLKLEFQNIANKIFEDKNKRFTDENKRTLDVVLNPVREQLSEFKKRIEDVYDKESKERVSLFNEIVHLKTLNQKISDDAVNLTNALKGQSKTQGAWGEVILERILEESGLHKGREYETQECFTADNGRQLRPDVVVHLPEGKDVVIDSKVSLTAYEKYCTTNTPEKRDKRLKEHILSIRTHIKGLSAKKYEDLQGIRTLDFVLMFLPIEGAFWTAIEQDTSLFNDAFAKNIMLVGPSSLLATLRIIQNIWRYEDQNRNAATIAKKGGDLYDKFVGFVESLEDIGHKIGKAQESYDKARSQLASGRGNLIRRTEELKGLGIKAKKTLPESLTDQAEEAEQQLTVPLTETVQ
jgi:DNA recombination protein RmuC